jgi:hypothetical protein
MPTVAPPQEDDSSQDILKEFIAEEMSPEVAIRKLRGDYDATRMFEMYRRPYKPRKSPRVPEKVTLPIALDLRLAQNEPITNRKAKTVRDLPVSRQTAREIDPTFTRTEVSMAPMSLLESTRLADQEITVRPRTHVARVRIAKPQPAQRPGTAGGGFGTLRTSTSQFTDHTQEIKVAHAIARLVKLREVGYRIERLIGEGTQFEENLANAQKINTEVKTGRLDSRMQMQDLNADRRQRNCIEQKEREEAAIAVKTRVYEVREEEGRKIRSDHAKRVKQFQAAKDFAQNFVCSSRKIAQISEHQTRKREEAKVFRKLYEKVQTARSERKHMKERHKKIMTELGEMKLETTRTDRERLERRRDEEKEDHEALTKRCRDWREAERKIMASVQDMRKTPQFFYPNQVPTVDTDEAEGAAYCIREYLGANLGDTEIHVLAEIIRRIV